MSEPVAQAFSNRPTMQSRPGCAPRSRTGSIGRWDEDLAEPISLTFVTPKKLRKMGSSVPVADTSGMPSGCLPMLPIEKAWATGSDKGLFLTARRRHFLSRESVGHTDQTAPSRTADQSLSADGYATPLYGKWHLDGENASTNGSAFRTPPMRPCGLAP